MQIIIPMSGFGERFRKAGYTVPKPLIEIEGKPVIAHVIDMFPGEKDFLFVCNQEHLDESRFRMREILQQYCPTGKIIGIAPHKKGPVYAVLQAMKHVDVTQPVVVNYCDFTCFWNWEHCKKFFTESSCDGMVPAYKGFHPHSLGTTNYAYMREKNGWLLDIQEKQPFTENRMQEFASSGTYFFATASLMQEAFTEVLERNINVGGEFYVSLAYKPLLERKKRIAVYELQHFMQWGTPEDVAEYTMWSEAFRHLIDARYAHVPAHEGSTLIPMAGFGERFSREGYTLTKPLIPVSGKPMVVQATQDLPKTEHHVFVLRKEMSGLEKIQQTLEQNFPNTQCTLLDGPTEGQACTALLGLKTVALDQPLTIAACDNGALYQAEHLQALLSDDTDLIVWVARGYANAARNPQMYGWIECEAGTDRVIGVSVKRALRHPQSDPMITGTFTFRRARDFVRTAERMRARDARVNGEFYIDTCIEDALALGLKVKTFELESYLCWGTPNDLRTFEYWQSCFHKWASHPYSLEQDARVPAEARAELISRYAAFQPNLPGVCA